MRSDATQETAPGGAAVLAACTVVAAIYRLALATTFWDVPGDGPSRTAMALGWAASPEVPLCGGWPPGFSFVVGTFSWLVPWPLWTACLMNVVLGTASVPLLHGIAARTYGAWAGLAAAAALAVFPLHAELSATSLTEVSFVFALLAAWRVLLGAAADEVVVRRRARLVAGGALVTLSEMLRYEGWVLAPVWVGWWALRRRDRRETALLALLALWFPITWTVGNAHCGDAFMGFRAALQEPSAGTGYALAAAAEHLRALATRELGTPIALLVLVGALLELGLACARRSTWPRLLALGLAGTSWALLLRFTISRGPSAWNRYALAALVLGLPFAFAPLRFWPRARRAGGVAAVVVAVTLLAMTLPDVRGARARHWLRSAPPTQATELARWLAADAARRTLPIVTTPVGWELWYLPLVDPELYPRLWVVSGWIAQDEVFWRVEGLRGAGPFLFATRDGDEADVARLEAVAGVPLTPGAPVFRSGPLRVYRVSLPVRGR